MDNADKTYPFFARCELRILLCKWVWILIHTRVINRSRYSTDKYLFFQKWLYLVLFFLDIVFMFSRIFLSSFLVLSWIMLSGCSSWTIISGEHTEKNEQLFSTWWLSGSFSHGDPVKNSSWSHISSEASGSSSWMDEIHSLLQDLEKIN